MPKSEKVHWSNLPLSKSIWGNLRWCPMANAKRSTDSQNLGQEKKAKLKKNNRARKKRKSPPSKQ